MAFQNLHSVRGTDDPVSGSDLPERLLRRAWVLFHDTDTDHDSLKTPDGILDLEAIGGFTQAAHDVEDHTGIPGVVLKSTPVTLIDAQIKGLPGTDVELIPTPGPGKMIVPLVAHLIADFAVAYTGIDAASSYPSISLNLPGLVGFSDDPDTPQADLTSLLSSTSPAPIWVMPMTTGATLVAGGSPTVVIRPLQLGPLEDIEDTALNLQASNSINFTGGDAANTLTITVLYTVLDV